MPTEEERKKEKILKEKERILREIAVESNLATKCYLCEDREEMHKHLDKVEELKKEFNKLDGNKNDQDDEK